MIELISDLNNLKNIIQEFKKVIDKNSIILLRGDLASGKTAFVKEFIKSFGINEDVSSPTFSIQQIYNDNIFHYDIYNKDLQEFIALGFLEELEKDGIHLVEWGSKELENILKTYGFNVKIIEIEYLNNKRKYRLK